MGKQHITRCRTTRLQGQLLNNSIRQRTLIYFTSGDGDHKNIYLDTSDGMTADEVQNWCKNVDVQSFELRTPRQHNGIFNCADLEIQVCELAGFINDQPNMAFFFILPPPQLWRVIRLHDMVHNALCRAVFTYPAKRPLNLYGYVEFMLETHLQLPVARRNSTNITLVCVNDTTVGKENLLTIPRGEYYSCDRWKDNVRDADPTVNPIYNRKLTSVQQTSINHQETCQLLQGVHIQFTVYGPNEPEVTTNDTLQAGKCTFIASGPRVINEKNDTNSVFRQLAEEAKGECGRFATFIVFARLQRIILCDFWFIWAVHCKLYMDSLEQLTGLLMVYASLLDTGELSVVNGVHRWVCISYIIFPSVATVVLPPWNGQ